MSNAEKTLHPDEKVKAGKLAGSFTKVGAGLAAAFGIISVLLGMSGWKRFFYSYVAAWSFILTIAIGALFFVMLHHLVRARWSTVLRRLAEIMASTFPVIAVAGLGIVIPLLAGYGDLYYWAHHDAHNHEINHHLVSKLGWWLNPTYFTVRYFIYFAVYIALARTFVKKSREQDESGDAEISTRLRVLSAPLMIVFSFNTVFVGFDVLMSLAPKWYSTIYSVNMFGGANIAFFSALILVALVVQRSGRLTRAITTEHYHDLGKWVFAWTFFWAYTAFSQFMLIWYANIPEETVFYKYRMFSEWQWVTIAVAVGHFAFPFVFLLSRWTKRILPSLTFFAVWQLVFHWLDLYWNVMPNYHWEKALVDGKEVWSGPLMGNPTVHMVGFSPVDVTLWFAMAGVFLFAVGRAMTGNLLPVKDPNLPASLSFENY